MRTFHLYKRMLTVQVLLLGAHHLMSGGFADGSRYSRASHAVLSGGDPIRERLARHLHRPRLPPPLLQEIKRRRSRFHPHRLGWSTPALPAPAARRLSPPPTPPWHRLLGPATRQALLLVHRGPGLSSTRKVVLASCHCPASPHPEAAATSRPRSVIQGCPRNPIPWCGTRCASGLLRTPRPGARTSRCRGAAACPPPPLPTAARRAAATSLLSWGCGGSSSLSPHPRSRAAQSRDAPHPSPLGAQRADSPGPARSLARHRAVTRLSLPFSAPGDYPSDPPVPMQGREPAWPSVLTPPREHRSPDAARGGWLQPRAAPESPGRDARNPGRVPGSAPRSPRPYPPAAASASAAASL